MIQEQTISRDQRLENLVEESREASIRKALSEKLFHLPAKVAVEITDFFLRKKLSLAPFMN